MKENQIKSHKSVGERIAAGMLDYIIIWSFTFYYIYAVGEPNLEGGYTVSGLPTLAIVLFWGIITVGIEQLIGATLGNLLVGLKPISIRGNEKKLTFGQSLKRHFLDPVDMFFFGLVGIVIIKNTEKSQRVGDIWANTIVVKKSELNKTSGNTVYN